MAARVDNRLLKPEVLARLGTLELVARTVVDGLLTGLHRSPHFGFSQEFAEYRAYNEGDDLRFVDWNVYARTDRAYIKRFRGETNTSVTLLLDASASMGYGEISKLDQSRYLAASLAYLTRKQHDALGLTIFDEGIRELFAPTSKPDSLMRVLGMLENTTAGSGTDLLGSLSLLRANMTKRGLVILISDLYADPDSILDALQPLAHAGQDVAVFHVLDPGELKPELKSISAMVDLETDETVVVDPEFLRTDYRTANVRVQTDQPLDSALHQYLQFRERRAR